MGSWNKFAGGQLRAQRLLRLVRGHDRAVLRKRLVIRFDMVERVEIIDHQAVGLLDALGGPIAEEVQPFEAGAVAEMEASHGIDRLAGRQLGLEEMEGGERFDRLSRLSDVAAGFERAADR